VQGGREVGVTLQYNSLLTQDQGRLGFGWSHEYEALIEGEANDVVTAYPVPQIVRFGNGTEWLLSLLPADFLPGRVILDASKRRPPQL
jgi:hypothetical protein